MIGGLILYVVVPSLFDVGGPSTVLWVVSILVLIPGAAIWIWSVILIMTNVPRGELITSGPYAWVKHPLYTAVALLALPWIGFLLNTWLGALLGVVLFGARWEAYRRSVRTVGVIQAEVYRPARTAPGSR